MDQIRFNANLDISTEEAQAKVNSLWQTFRTKGGEAAKAAGKELELMLGGEIKQKIVIEPSVDGSELKAFQGETLSMVDKITKSVDKQLESQKGSLTNMKAQLRTATQQRDKIVKIAVETDKYGRTTRRVTDQWRAQNKVVNDLNRKVADLSGNWTKMITSRIPGGQNVMNLANGLSQISLAATGVMAAFQGISSAVQPLVNRQRQIEALDMSLQGFGLTADQSKQIMERATAQGLRYGASIVGLEKGYKRITPAMLASGSSMKDVSDTMAAISARTTTLGLNTEQSKRYIEAFAQVMGKGKLQGEELNQQFSELDGALRAQIAKYMEAKHGITDFNKAMENGEIKANMFQEAFVSVSQNMVDNLGGAIGEVQTRMDELNTAQIENIINNLNTISMDSLRDSLGPIGESFRRIQVAMSQFFTAITTNLPGIKTFMMNFFKGLGIAIDVLVRAFMAGAMVLLKGFDMIISALGSAIEWIAKNIPGVKEVIKGLGDGANALGEQFDKGTDLILQMGEGAVETGDSLSDLDGRLLVLKNQLAEGTITLEEYNAEKAKIDSEMDLQQNIQALQGLEDKIKEVKEEIKGLKGQQADAKSMFDGEKEKLDELKRGVQEFFRVRKEELDAQKQATTSMYDTEIAGIKRAQEAQESRHDVEMTNLRMRNQEIQSAIQAEIDALGQKTPAEQKLAQLREAEIRDKLRSGQLNEKEKLQLQAQLERMERQKQVEEAQLKLKAEKENAAKAEAALAKKQKAEADALKQAEKAAQEAKKKALDEIKQKQEELKKQQAETLQLFEKTKKTVDLSGQSLSDIQGLIRDQVKNYQDAESAVKGINTQLETSQNKLRNLEGQARRTAQAIRSAQSASNNARSGLPPQSFAGGAVRAGEYRTVNEIGREGFITSSGKMKEISTKAWGAWKAPSSGTIIPAHIWAGIKAQSQGMTGTTMPTAAGVSGGLMGQVARLAGQRAGDVVNNQVTIQSDNVDRTMAQSLVSLRRTKRARYY